MAGRSHVDVSLLEQWRSAIQSLLPPHPWLGWLVVALCRHRARQDWLVSVRDAHLVDPEDDSGFVPGLPGPWRYRFHGRGLLLEGPAGEAIDVDFHADHPHGSVIDPYFFAWRIESLPQPGLPERRLCSWLPSRRSIVPGLRQLQRSGVIHHPTSDHVFLLHPWLEAHYLDVCAVDFGDPEVARSWDDVLGGSTRTSEGDAAFAAWIEQLMRTRDHASILEDVASTLAAPEARRLATGLLDGPIDAATGRALRVLRAIDAPPDQAVFDLLDRLDPQHHHPFAAHAMASLLLQAGVLRERALELVERFAAVDVVEGFRGNPYADNLAILMLEHAPDRAPPLVDRALQSTTPACYEAMGALLSLIDDEDSRRLVLRTAAVAEPAKKRFLLAALWYSDDAATREAAAQLMPAPPQRSGAVGFTFEEVQYTHLRANVERRRARMRATYARLRPH